MRTQDIVVGTAYAYTSRREHTVANHMGCVIVQETGLSRRTENWTRRNDGVLVQPATRQQDGTYVPNGQTTVIPSAYIRMPYYDYLEQHRAVLQRRNEEQERIRARQQETYRVLSALNEVAGLGCHVREHSHYLRLDKDAAQRLLELVSMSDTALLERAESAEQSVLELQEQVEQLQGSLRNIRTSLEALVYDDTEEEVA